MEKNIQTNKISLRRLQEGYVHIYQLRMKYGNRNAIPTSARWWNVYFKLALQRLLLLTLVALIGCGTTTANKIAGKPDRPVISGYYQNLLILAGPETAKAAQKHEWDWQGYADKMEQRVGY